MLTAIKKLFTDTKGNVAIITGGTILPILALVAGGIEIAETSRLKRSMQHAADTAVMAAFQKPDLSWSKRIKLANDFFDSNFPHDHRVLKIKKRLSGQQTKRRVILEYTASAENKSLTRGINPFTEITITVKSRALYIAGSFTPPKLIASGSVSLENPF